MNPLHNPHSRSAGHYKRAMTAVKRKLEGSDKDAEYCRSHSMLIRKLQLHPTELGVISVSHGMWEIPLMDIPDFLQQTELPDFQRDMISNMYKDRMELLCHPPTDVEQNVNYISHLFDEFINGASLAANERMHLLLKILLEADDSVLNQYTTNREQADSKIERLVKGSWLMRSSSIADSQDKTAIVRVISTKCKRDAIIRHFLLIKIVGLGYVIMAPLDEASLADCRERGMPNFDDDEARYFKMASIFSNFIDAIDYMSKSYGFDLDLLVR